MVFVSICICIVYVCPCLFSSDVIFVGAKDLHLSRVMIIPCKMNKPRGEGTLWCGASQGPPDGRVDSFLIRIGPL